jgi:hypothetical protein
MSRFRPAGAAPEPVAVSETTVKTHVGRVLMKLGSATACRR